jgi:ligand-binding SRPBCC domain-containing protein
MQEMVLKFCPKHLELLPEDYKRRIKVIHPNLEVWIFFSNMNCHRTTTKKWFPKLIIVSEVWEIRVHLGASTGLAARIP